MQWTTQEHPIINKTPWSKQESQRLSELVDEIGLNGQWEHIANKLGTNRTISQCFSHYMAYKNNQEARSLKWTDEEDKKLADAVKIFGNCNWQQVAATLKGRTGQQCLHRWEKSINPAIKRTRWTDEESVLLKRAVQLYGAGNWKKVQLLLPGRTDMQCRERWINVIEAKNSKLTEEEVQKLVELVKQVGGKWSYIAGFFPGRTDNFILRQYRNYLKRDERNAKLNERILKNEEKMRLKEQLDKERKERLEKELKVAEEKARKKMKMKAAKAAKLAKRTKATKSTKSTKPTKSTNPTKPTKRTKRTREESISSADELTEIESDHEEPIIKKLKPTKADAEYRPSNKVSMPSAVRRSNRLQKN